MALPDVTCWSMIRDAAGGDPAARERFARVYLPVVTAYLAARWRGAAARRRRRGPGRLRRVFPRRRAPGEGRSGEQTAGSGRSCLGPSATSPADTRRGSASLPNFPRTCPADDTAPAEAFDRAWARSLLKEAARVQEESRAAGRARAMNGRSDPAAIPLSRWAADPGHRRAVGEDAAKLHHEYATAREEFRAALRIVVAFHHPGATDGEIERACVDLFGLMRCTPAG